MQETNVIAQIQKLTGIEQDLVRILRKHPDGIRQADMLTALSGSLTQSSISRRLSKMIDAGLVIKKGSTKAAMFSLTPQALHWSTPPQLRPKSYFDPKRFDDYIPNQTKWLPESVRLKMEQAGTQQHHLDASTFSKEIAERFLIDLAWASSSLEGNTYSLLETETLIKYGEQAPDKDQADATMILNHKKAINILLDAITTREITDRLVSSMHASLMRSFLDPSVLGQVRNHGVKISHSSYEPSDNKLVLKSALGQLLFKAEQIEDPFEAMFFLTAGIAYIQPFEDGNKRMGRLLGNLPLLRAGLAPISFIGVDKNQYIQGLLSFYELGEKDLLAQSLQDGYLISAATYHVTHATKRVFRSVELKAHHELNSALHEIITQEFCLDEDIEKCAAKHAKDLSPEMRDDFLQCVKDYAHGLTIENSCLWGVSEDQAKSYLAQRSPKMKPGV